MRARPEAGHGFEASETRSLDKRRHAPVSCPTRMEAEQRRQSKRSASQQLRYSEYTDVTGPMRLLVEIPIDLPTGSKQVTACF